MQAYLQSQEVWIIVDPPAGISEPTLNQTGSNRADVLAWHQSATKAMGCMKLRLNIEVARSVKDKTTPKELWDMLKELYGGSSAMVAFSFLKAAMNVRIPPNEHPSPAISKIQGNLDEFNGAGIAVPPAMRALMVLGAAPPRYDAAIQVLLGKVVLKDLTVIKCQEALVASWEQSKNKGQSSAQKITAIKQRKGNLSFSQQQRPSGSSSAGQKDGGDDKGKGKATDDGGFKPRGKRAGKSRKQRNQQTHVHIADTVSVPAPSTSKVTKYGPSGSKPERSKRQPPTWARSATRATGCMAPFSSPKTSTSLARPNASGRWAKSPRHISKKSSPTPNRALQSAAERTRR